MQDVVACKEPLSMTPTPSVDPVRLLREKIQEDLKGIFKNVVINNAHAFRFIVMKYFLAQQNAKLFSQFYVENDVEILNLEYGSWQFLRAVVFPTFVYSPMFIYIHYIFPNASEHANPSELEHNQHALCTLLDDVDSTFP